MDAKTIKAKMWDELARNPEMTAFDLKDLFDTQTVVVNKLREYGVIDDNEKLLCGDPSGC